MWFRRRKIIVDPKFQVKVAVYVGGSLLAIAVNYVGAVLIFGGNVYQPHTGEEVRDLLIEMSIVFTGLAAIHLMGLAFILTHRVAGPTLVLERALKGLREGDYSNRMTLRNRDCLQTLAAEVQKLSLHLQKNLGDVDRCLSEQDYEAAREIVARLRGENSSEPQPELEPEQKPELEPEPEPASEA